MKASDAQAILELPITSQKPKTDTGRGNAVPCVESVTGAEIFSLGSEPSLRRHERLTQRKMLPARISHYRLLEKIGEGGMGSVYKAEDERLKRFVAIKLLPAEAFDDASTRSRFLQEARAASQLNHPNVVTVHDVGTEGDQPYIVMELASGRSIDLVLPPRGFDVPKALSCARQTADALRVAHRAGIVHRDLKPANVIVSDEGHIKLVDFGLAKFFEQSTPQPPDGDKTTEMRPLTREGIVVGTPAYMSPEQAAGGNLDARSDIFAFGLLLYEMLCGHHPFPRGASAHFAERSDDEALDMLEFPPRVPEHLRTVATRCLERLPERRYQTADALFEALSMPRPPPNKRRIRRFLMATGVVAVVAIAVAFSRFASDGRRPPLLPSQMHLVVLPFATFEAPEAPARRAFSDGLTETLTSKLTQLEQGRRALWVVPFSEVRSLGTTSVAEARRAFAVNLAVTGSVQRGEDGIRLTLNLVDAVTLRQLASTIVDRERSELIDLQDTAAFRLAGMLQIELPPSTMATLTSPRAESRAQELYLEGRGHLLRYDQPERLETAVALFQEAIAEDPAHVLAHASLGEAYWRLYEQERESVLADEAIRVSERAVALGPDSPAALVTLGLVQVGTGEGETAIASFQRALALDDRNHEARRGLAKAYESLGRFDEALGAYREAIALRPDYWDGHGQLGVFFWRHGRYDEAVEQFERVIRITPDNHRGYTNLGGIYFYLGRTEDARAMFERSIEIRPSYEAYSNLGTLHFAARRYTEAAEVYEKAISLDSSDYQVVMNLANAYYWSGQETAAATNYERALTMVRERLRVNPTEPYLLVSLAQLAASTERPSEAQAALEQIEPFADDVDVELLVLAAEAYMGLENREKTLTLLRRAVEGGYPYETLSSNPTFEDLVSELETR